MKQQPNKFWSLLLRGFLGGVLGVFVVAAVEICLLRPTGWDNWLGYFFIISLVSLPFGLLVGPVLGVVIWFLRRETGIPFGMVSTTIIGTIAGTVAITIWWALTSEHLTDIVTSTKVLGAVLLGAAFGGVPGLVVGMRILGQTPSRNLDGPLS